jgi:hypothetical protein
MLQSKEGIFANVLAERKTPEKCAKLKLVLNGMRFAEHNL